LFQSVGNLASFLLLFCEIVIVVLVWFYCEILTISMSFLAGFFLSLKCQCFLKSEFHFVKHSNCRGFVLRLYLHQWVGFWGLFLSWNHQYTVVRPGSYLQSIACLLNSNFTLWNSEILVFLLWDCSYFSELVLGHFHPLTFSM
jgi:hypothetical protein